MSTKPNYFKLGLFILIALFLLIAGIILFGSGIFEKERPFLNPISGLRVRVSPGVSGSGNGVVKSELSNGSALSGTITPAEESTDGFFALPALCAGYLFRSSGRFPESAQRNSRKSLDFLVKNGLRLQLSTNILTGQGYIEAGYWIRNDFPWNRFRGKPKPFYSLGPQDFTTMKDSVDKILQRLEQIETEKIADNINNVLESIDKAVNDLMFPESPAVPKHFWTMPTRRLKTLRLPN